MQRDWYCGIMDYHSITEAMGEFPAQIYCVVLKNGGKKRKKLDNLVKKFVDLEIQRFPNYWIWKKQRFQMKNFQVN